MQVLITGHLGYIGTVMSGTFRSAGLSVIGLDIGYFDDYLPDGAQQPAAHRQIIADIRDVTPDDLAGVDTVVHLAALSNDPLGELNPDLTHAINYAATVRLAQIAKDMGVGRFVFASSCSIYGISDQTQIPVNEDSPLNPLTSYSVSKAQAEEGLASLADANFSPTFMRCATVYGVSPRMRLDLVVNNLVAGALATGQVRVLSDGTPWRPLIHVEDLCRATLAIVQAPRELIHNQVFNIGRNDSNFQVTDIAEAVVKCVPGSKLVITGENGSDPRSYRVDFTKMENRINQFKPKWTLEMGCQQVRNWLNERRATSCQPSMFFRVQRLKQLMEEGVLDGRLRPKASKS